MSHSNVPDEIRWLFWDCDPDSLDIDKHRDFLIRRVLVDGDWSAIEWLRASVGDAGLRDWFLAGRGGQDWTSRIYKLLPERFMR